MDLLDTIDLPADDTNQEDRIKPISNSFGNEIMVDSAKGRGVEDIYNKMDKQALAGMATFAFFKNSGVNDFRQSSLFPKIDSQDKMNQFLNTLDDINGLMKRIGKNKALSLQNIELKNDENNTSQKQGDISDTSSIKSKIASIEKSRKRILTENKMLFLTNLEEREKKYIVGYETYEGGSNNKPTNAAVWERWDDVSLIKLIEAGATVQWYAPSRGPLANKSFTFDMNKHKENFEKILEYMANNAFSFHEVWIDEDIPVINSLRRIAEFSEKYRGTKPSGNLQKTETINGNDKAIKKEETLRLEDVFPTNPKGKFVNSNILYDDNYSSIFEVGPGLIDARVTGGFKEKYLGVEIIDTVMKDVIGNDNYVFITGTLIKVILDKDITINGDCAGLKFDPIEYKMAKGQGSTEITLMRGIYIDKEGNFKIGQIATKISIGDSNNLASREATAAQLIKRKMVTETFPIFKSITEKLVDRYETAAQRAGETKGDILRTGLMEGKTIEGMTIDQMANYSSLQAGKQTIMIEPPRKRALDYEPNDLLLVGTDDDRIRKERKEDESDLPTIRVEAVEEQVEQKEMDEGE